MSPSITFNGVDNAISNLNYRNKRALKYKFVKTIRSFYKSEDLFDTIREIDTDELIGLMWETDDPEEIKSKRINFTSIKAAVNSDLKKLYEKGMNSEGLTVSPENTFDMSAEAKDQLYQSFVNSIQADGKLDFHKVSVVLNMINSFLETAQNSVKDQESDEVIRKIQAILNSLSTKVIDEDYDPELYEGQKRVIIPDEHPDDEFEYLDSDDEDDSEFDFSKEEEAGKEDADELEFLDEDYQDEFDFEDIEDEFEDIDEIVDEEFDYLDEDDEDYGIEEEPDDEEYEEIIIDEDEIQDGDEVIKSLEDDGSDEDIDFLDDDEFEEDEIDDEDYEEFDLEEEDEFDYFDDEDDEDDEIVDDEEYDDLEYEDEEFEFADDDDIEFIDEDDEFEDEIIDDEDFEEIELDEDEEFEFIDNDEDIEFIDEDEQEEEDYEEIELDDDEELEFEDIDDDYDEVEEDDFREIIDDDYDIEEIDDDSEIEEIEGDDFEFVDEEDEEEEEEFEELNDEDFEEIELDEEFFDDDYDYEELEENEEDVDFVDEDEDFELQEVDEEFDDLELDQDEMEDFDILDEDPDYSEASEKSRLRAEKFDEFLGTIEKQYNLYEAIPAGRYKIGTEYPKGNELIEQRVSLPDFYLGKYPITNSLFEIFVQKTGYITTAEKKGFGKVYEGRFKKIKDPSTGKFKTIISSSFTSRDIKGATWYQPEGPGSNLHNRRNHPVVQVSYDDAVAFAKWVGKRLPTEFEWEGAARTKKGNIYPWGDKFDKTYCNTDSSETANVDKYPEGVNRYDIFDLLGNVFEWTKDQTEPPYKRENNDKYYIVKGGSFISDKNITLYSRSMFKNDYTANIIGFRCVLK